MSKVFGSLSDRCNGVVVDRSSCPELGNRVQYMTLIKKVKSLGPLLKRDLSGIWEPAQGPGAAIQGKGAMAMESCRRDKATGKFAVQANPPLTDTGYATRDCLRPEVEPPYTPLGLERLKAHKPTEGYRMVPPAFTNDPAAGL